jgi:hypothetical protein
MTDFEWFLSAHYKFLHSPEVATLRAHYERNGFPYFEKTYNKQEKSCAFYDRNNELMFTVTSDSLFQLYKKVANIISASMQ